MPIKAHRQRQKSTFALLPSLLQGGFLKTVLFLVSTILYQKTLCMFSLQNQQWACWGYIQTLGVLRVCGGFPGAGGGGESS